MCTPALKHALFLRQWYIRDVLILHLFPFCLFYFENRGMQQATSRGMSWTISSLLLKISGGRMDLQGNTSSNGGRLRPVPFRHLWRRPSHQPKTTQRIFGRERNRKHLRLPGLVRCLPENWGGQRADRPSVGQPNNFPRDHQDVSARWTVHVFHGALRRGSADQAPWSVGGRRSHQSEADLRSTVERWRRVCSTSTDGH